MMKKYPYQVTSCPRLPGIYEPITLQAKQSYDGDTIKVVLSIVGNASIRLAGIDTPELKGATEEERTLAIKARDYTREVLNTSESLWCWLAADAMDKDGDGRITMQEAMAKASFGRWPGTVFCNGKDLRQMLLSKDFAYRTDMPQTKTWG